MVTGSNLDGHKVDFIFAKFSLRSMYDMIENCGWFDVGCKAFYTLYE